MDVKTLLAKLKPDECIGFTAVRFPDAAGESPDKVCHLAITAGTTVHGPLTMATLPLKADGYLSNAAIKEAIDRAISVARVKVKEAEDAKKAVEAGG